MRVRTRRRACFWPGLGVMLLAGHLAFGQAPYGFDSRAPIGPYLNNQMPPSAGAFPIPPLLSETGAFADVVAAIPVEGVVPFTVNSPLWTDGALKTRWIALPNDGSPYGDGEQIGFAPTGEWTFPDGTVFVKEFDLIVNEQTQARRRLETRLLVRDENGAVYGVTYKWRADNSDADLLPDGLNEEIPILQADGTTRLQTYTYPSRAECLVCHNPAASYILGPKTHQLNGNFTYPSTGRTDNQLRTMNHLGMFTPALDEADIPNYLHSVFVEDPTNPIQMRMRSWIDSNCSQCHRPGGIGPGYDGRFYTPFAQQNLVNSYLQFRNLAGSLVYQRDDALDATKMPPLAKNRVHEAAMTVMRQFIASPLEVLSAYLYQDLVHIAVRFNSVVDPETATDPAHYSLDQGATVTDALIGDEADTVILSISPLTENQSYILMISDVQDTALSANTIWPGSQLAFAAIYPPSPSPNWLADVATRVKVGTGDDAMIAGFIARGGPEKRVMVRALGPSLADKGVTGELSNPTLELYDAAGTLIATNDNWKDNYNEQEIIDTGIPPTMENEAVILMKLPSTAGGTAYTAVMRGAAEAAGIGLLEVYDLDRGLGPDLLNVSTRGKVELEEGVMIGGVIVQGTQPQTVITRALGPSLADRGVTGELADPTLELRDENGDLIFSNDNWRSDQEQEIIDSMLQPVTDNESAIVALLPAGSYTAVLRGASDTTGVALVEIYALD